MSTPHQRYGVVVGIDIVGFSRNPHACQIPLIDALEAAAAASLPKDWSWGESAVLSPAGDGLFAAFLSADTDANVKVAFDFCRNLGEQPGLAPGNLRLGIAAGLIQGRKAFLGVDSHEAWNVIGDAINLAARVMGIGDGGHLLVSQCVYQHFRRVCTATDFELFLIGDYEVKHGHVLTVYAASGTRRDGKGSFRWSVEAVPTPKGQTRINWATDPTALVPVFSTAQPVDDLMPLGAHGHGVPVPAEDFSAEPALRERFSAGAEMPFLVAEALVTLHRDTRRVELTVRLSDRPRVAVNGDHRSRFERSNENSGHPAARALESFHRGMRGDLSGPLRFSAGGSIPLLYCQPPGGGRPVPYVVVGRKDDRAPLHPGHLIAACGLSESTQEWVNPYLTVFRETFEEVLIFERTSNGMMPVRPRLSLADDQAFPQVEPAGRGHSSLKRMRAFSQATLIAALSDREFRSEAIAQTTYEEKILGVVLPERLRTRFAKACRRNVDQSLSKSLAIWASGNPLPQGRIPGELLGTALATPIDAIPPTPVWLLPLFDPARAAGDAGFEELFDRLILSWSNQTTRVVLGHLAIDPEFAAVDLMASILIDLHDRTLDDLLLLDGEFSRGQPLDRVLYVFSPTEFAKLMVPGIFARAEAVFQSGSNLLTESRDADLMRFLPPNPKMHPPLLQSAIPLLHTWLAGALNPAPSAEQYSAAEQVFRLPNSERSYVSVPAEREG